MGVTEILRYALDDKMLGFSYVYTTLMIFKVLVRSFEFLQEAGIVFREQTQVVHTILQVGDTFDTHTESVA